jgi:hypothetical protein
MARRLYGAALAAHERKKMARTQHRRHSAALVPYRVSSPKPIVIRTTKVVKAKHHRKHHRSSGGMGGMLGNFASKERIGIAAGAFALGYIQKQNWNIPKLPVLGETGTIALGAHLISDGGRNKLAADICTAALAVAAYTLANTGSIVGEEGVGYVAGVGGY